MLCYKDMTFCYFYTSCKDGASCHRALTPEVVCEAEKLDIAISQFAGTPECWNKYGSKEAI